MPRLPYKDAAHSRVGDLRLWLQRYGAMAPAPALRLVAELCTELGATHKQGGVHGAIEPNNVLLDTARDGGLVAHLRSPETAIADDPAYRPPERDVDAATTSSGDIYSMGCLLWACLTGAPPRAGTHQALRLADGRPAPPELGTLLDGMLRADPADRFRSAGEIGREAAWIADRLDPDGTAAPALRAGAASTSAPWKNFGMVGVVGVALLAIAASGYAVVNLVNDPVDPPAQAAPAPAPSSRAPLPTPTPSAIVHKTTFTCWNGRIVAKKKRCQEPHGTSGLYWIFPLLKGQNCRPREADSTPGRDSLLECYFYGRDVKLNVSLWRDIPTGVGHYSDLEHLGQPATEAGANGKTASYRWEDISRWRGYRYLNVRLWMKHAYSVAVYARRRDLAEVIRNSGYLTPVPDKRYYGSRND